MVKSGVDTTKSSHNSTVRFVLTLLLSNYKDWVGETYLEDSGFCEKKLLDPTVNEFISMVPRNTGLRC